MDSRSLYESELGGEFVAENTLNVIIGMDSGLLVNYLLSLSLASGSRFVVVELEGVLSLLNIDLPKEVKDIISIVNIDEFESCVADGLYDVFFARNSFKTHFSMAVRGNYLRSYSLLSTRVQKCLEHQYFEQRLSFNQKSFIALQFKNLADNLLPASILKGKFNKETAIIIGGGPSLDLHIQWLKNHQTKLIIIVASRVAGKLTKYGIIPDIVVSVDPQPISYEVNDELMLLEHKSLLIHSFHIEHRILSQWRGGALYTGDRFPWLSGHNKSNIESIGPTVTNSAIEVASSMGFEQILLLGVDFCHSQSGETHTKDTYGTQLGPQLGTMYEWVETYSGKMAETPIQLMHAITSLKESIGAYPNCTYINIAIEAAKVEGVEYRDIKNIKLNAIDDKLRQLLDSSNYKLDFKEKKSILVQCLSDVIATENKLEGLNTQLNKALVLIKKSTEASDAKLASLFGKLDAIDEIISTKYNMLSTLSKLYGYEQFSGFFSSKDIETRSKDDVLHSIEKYYCAFSKTVEKLKALISISKNNIQLRLDEGDETEDLHYIIERWRENEELGRSILWQQEFPERYNMLPESLKLALAECEREFLAFFKTTSQASKPQTEPILVNAFHKLHLLNYSRHELGLTKMVDYTESFVDTNIDVLRLHYLAKSYLLLLQGEVNHSLDAILSIPKEQRLEVELKQLVKLQIQLKQFDEASVNLKKLCEFSDEYMPKYAKIMSLMKQYQPALSAYLDYLDLHPKDIPVLLEISQFLMQLGEGGYALQYVEQVLMLDQANATALGYKNIIQSA
ncbi:motility associated factor glycosyltransferase family protein [Shewanella intestini]|nr:6-hydroxymethylpterin diphosphokinase MptE-like protein [Shewanella intestini]